MEISNQELSKMHFDFLLTDYGFKYIREQNVFASEKMKIYISHTRTSINVEIWYKSEPIITRINYKWYVYCLEGIDILQAKSLKNNLVDNYQYYASLLRGHISQMIKEGAEIVPKVINLFLEDSRKIMQISMDEMIKNNDKFRELYKYVSSTEQNIGG